MRVILMVLILLGNTQLRLFSANQLISAVMEVQLEESTDRIVVTINCRVSLDSEIEQIPVRIVGDESIQILDPTLLIQGQIYPIDLKYLNQRVAKANILGIDQIGRDSLMDILIQYQVSTEAFQKRSKTITVPVLFIDWKPEAASADAFKAIVQLPEGYSLRPVFPAMQWKKAQGASRSVYSFDLETVPAWVKFKVFRGSLPFFSLELLVDLGVITVLVFLMFLGLNKMKPQK